MNPAISYELRIYLQIFLNNIHAKITTRDSKTLVHYDCWELK